MTSEPSDPSAESGPQDPTTEVERLDLRDLARSALEKVSGQSGSPPPLSLGRPSCTEPSCGADAVVEVIYRSDGVRVARLLCATHRGAGGRDARP